MFIYKIVYLCACTSFVWAHRDTGQSRVKKIIINGWRASSGKYPFMVKVQPNAAQHFCGGSLISPYTVLTASHCVTFNGTVYLQTVYPYDCKKEACRHEVKTIIYHRQYNFETFENDIALLMLKRPFCASYRSIKLSEFDISKTKYVGSNVTLAGWGITENLQLSNDLLETRVKIVSKKRCLEYHEDDVFPKNIICAGSKETDSCYADSGGPLFLRKGRDYVVVGVISNGDDDCADPNKTDFRMGVYTNVFRYRKWIADQVETSQDPNRDRSTVKKLIIKGWKAPSGKYPFMVKVQPNATQNFCGGSLISPFLVLTAAHCVEVNGSIRHQNAYPYDCKEEACRHDVEQTIYHKDYDNENFRNDIAILKLKTPFSASYRPIRLADYDISDPQYEGTQVSLAGWGVTETLELSKDLMETKVNIMSNKECLEHHDGQKPEDHFCAGSMESDSCYSDSGGPLFLQKGGNYVVFGIVSYGDEDCYNTSKTGQRMGAYTNVFKYLDWIASQSEKSFSERPVTTKKSIFGFFGKETVHIF